MAMNDVVVTITQNKVVGSEGFGVPLVIQGKADAEKKYTECSKLDEVLDAGFGDDTEVYKQCEKLFSQANRPKLVGVYAGTGKITESLRGIESQSFRQIVPVFGTEDDTPKELADYVEASDGKLLFLKVSSAEELAELGSLDRTIAIVYTGEDKGVEGAVVGATAGLAAGSFTYKNMIIKGITPDNLTDGQISTIHKAHGIAIVKKAGDIVTSEGFVLSGEYADIIDSIDYVVNDMAYRCQKLLNTVPKVPYDNVGISMLEGVTTTVLAEAYRMGIIAQNGDGTPAYSTDFAPREDCSAGDRAARTYNEGRFSFDLAGAIHYAHINGVINV
ncbi:MAG: DUF3383 family protein [Lachnospiraceae bacterium]|nr:DUF3383 family protein [Lachnospiraceae bacterium]